MKSIVFGRVLDDHALLSLPDGPVLVIRANFEQALPVVLLLELDNSMVNHGILHVDDLPPNEELIQVKRPH